LIQQKTEFKTAFYHKDKNQYRLFNIEYYQEQLTTGMQIRMKNKRHKKSKKYLELYSWLLTQRSHLKFINRDIKIYINIES